MFLRKLSSFGNALRGLKVAYAEESNFRIQLALAGITIFLGYWLQVSVIEWLILAGTIGFVLTAELLNTALEELCDMLKDSPDPHVGKIKDLAAGAVLVSSIAALVVGVIIFLPKMLGL